MTETDPDTDPDPDPDPDPEREIRDLHAFFEGWYAGERDDAARLDRALAPEFEMITPEGAIRGREAVVDGIVDAAGQHADATPPFEIAIEAVRRRPAPEGHHLLTYEEHQSGPDGGNVRLSTVLFREDPDAPRGVVWAHLHETWLEAPEG